MVRRKKKTASPQQKRSALIKECEKLLFKILKKERGEMCELCGGTALLGTFHIMSKKTYPRIRLNKQNLLIAGWYCCHHLWHHDIEVQEVIHEKIKKLRGNDYRDQLKALDAFSPKLSMTRLNLLHEAFKKELEVS